MIGILHQLIRGTYQRVKLSLNKFNLVVVGAQERKQILIRDGEAILQSRHESCLVLVGCATL